jgi:hypothetical protein
MPRYEVHLCDRSEKGFEKNSLAAVEAPDFPAAVEQALALLGPGDRAAIEIIAIIRAQGVRRPDPRT